MSEAILWYVLALLVVLLIREWKLDSALDEHLLQMDKLKSMAGDLVTAMKPPRKST